MGSIYKPTWTKDGGRHESQVCWIKYYRNGAAMRESSQSTKEGDAKQLLNLREGDVARGVPVTPKVGRVKFDELAEDLVNDYLVNNHRSIEELRIRLRKHVTPFFGGRRASSINTADIRKFTLQRQAAGASNGEINRELATVKRALTLALQAGKLLMRPYIPMLKENNVRTGFFEPEQFASVQKHLREELRSLMKFFYITGWRKTEVLALQWRHVDSAAGQVSLDPGTTKNDAGRTFPFTVELRKLLEAQRVHTSVIERKLGAVIPWVFHRRGRPIRDFRGAWREACKLAGLAGRIPHDFRRTAVRNLVRAGIPERVAMQMTGHKTRAVFERYNIVSKGDLLDAARRLDEVAGKVSGKADGSAAEPAS